MNKNKRKPFLGFKAFILSLIHSSSNGSPCSLLLCWLAFGAEMLLSWKEEPPWVQIFHDGVSLHSVSCFHISPWFLESVRIYVNLLASLCSNCPCLWRLLPQIRFHVALLFFFPVQGPLWKVSLGEHTGSLCFLLYILLSQFKLISWPQCIAGKGC